MEGIKERIKSSPLLQAVIVNTLIMAVLLLVMHPYLENQADVIMQDLIYGDYDGKVPTDAVLFSSFMLGDALIWLVRLAPALPWYIICHCFLSFISIVIICNFVFRRSERYEGRLLMIGLCVYMGYECYVIPGYLKTACVLTAAAVSLLLSFMLKETSHKKACLILAVITGVLASLTAFFVFAVFFALCAVLSLIYVLTAKPYRDKRELRVSLAGAIAAAGCIYVLGAGFYYLDRLHYFRDPSLSASIAYRLGYEKCLSYGVPYFKFRDAEIKAANEAVYRLGALDPGLVDTNERLIYMGQARLFPTLYEIGNFFAFEPGHISHAPLLYLWGFLAYILARYGGRKGRIAVCISGGLGMVTLFFMRQFLILGYYRMYTLVILPFALFLMLWVNCIEYRPPAGEDERTRRLMLTADVLLAVFLAFVIFGDDFPVKKDMVHETEILYVEDDSTDQTDTEAEI